VAVTSNVVIPYSHIVLFPAVDINTGRAFTVTTMLVGVPGQELAVGVTIYVTVPSVVPGFISVWAMVVPFEAVAPVIPPVIAPIVQLKVAPGTLLLNEIFVVAPLQIVVGSAVVTFGLGFTVTSISSLVVPQSPVEVAVMVADPMNIGLQFIKPVIELITPAVTGTIEYIIDVLFAAVAVYVPSGAS
jgi:hypothetical protein